MITLRILYPFLTGISARRASLHCRTSLVARLYVNRSANCVIGDSGSQALLDTYCLIDALRSNQRGPYPPSKREQVLLFSEWVDHLTTITLFKKNTGLREMNVINLGWPWNVDLPELNTSFFIVPRDFVKNALDRYVVLNSMAKSVIEGYQGKHAEFVFTGAGKPITDIYTPTGRRRAAAWRVATLAGS